MLLLLLLLTFIQMLGKRLRHFLCSLLKTFRGENDEPNDYHGKDAEQTALRHCVANDIGDKCGTDGNTQ